MSEVRERAGRDGATPTDPLWDDWDTPPRVPTCPELHVDGFDGPLDLLLDLAERQRIDLGRISILAVVDQFIEALVTFADHAPLERRADWLVMASRLLLLRSRLCFPASLETKADEPQARSEADRREDLRRVRAAVAWLDDRPQIGRDVFVRPSGPSPRVSSYMDLMEACLAVLVSEEEQAASSGSATVLRLRPTTLFPVAGVLADMRRRLAELDAPAELKTFVPAIPDALTDRPLVRRCAVSSALMAALELGRVGKAVLLQEDGAHALLVGSAEIRARS